VVLRVPLANVSADPPVAASQRHQLTNRTHPKTHRRQHGWSSRDTRQGWRTPAAGEQPRTPDGAALMRLAATTSATAAAAAVRATLRCERRLVLSAAGDTCALKALEVLSKLSLELLRGVDSGRDGSGSGAREVGRQRWCDGAWLSVRLQRQRGTLSYWQGGRAVYRFELELVEASQLPSGLVDQPEAAAAAAAATRPEQHARDAAVPAAAPCATAACTAGLGHRNGHGSSGNGSHSSSNVGGGMWVHGLSCNGTPKASLLHLSATRESWRELPSHNGDGRANSHASGTSSPGSSHQQSLNGAPSSAAAQRDALPAHSRGSTAVAAAATVEPHFVQQEQRQPAAAAAAAALQHSDSEDLAAGDVDWRCALRHHAGSAETVPLTGDAHRVADGLEAAIHAGGAAQLSVLRPRHAGKALDAAFLAARRVEAAAGGDATGPVLLLCQPAVQPQGHERSSSSSSSSSSSGTEWRGRIAHGGAALEGPMHLVLYSWPF